MTMTADEWEYQEGDPGSGLKSAWAHTACPGEHIFNMDLANGPTAERFCIAAAGMLDIEMGDVQAAAAAGTLGGEWQDNAVQGWTASLEDAGYRVEWYAGDVTVTKPVPPADEMGCRVIYRPGFRDPQGVECLDCGATLDFPEPDFS